MDDSVPETAGHCAPLVVKGVKALYRAFQNMSMYAPGHRLVWEAVEQAAEAFSDALADREKLVITVVSDHLICEQEKISESSIELHDLASLLYKLDIVAVEFYPGLTIDELADFLQALALARREKFDGAKLIETIAEYSVEKICLYTIDYGTLYFAEGTKEDRAGEPAAEDTWTRMARLLTDPTAVPTYGALQHLANEIAGQIHCYEGLGVQALREKMHEVMENMQNQSPDQRDMIRMRMAEFVASLNENLREDLLRVTSQSPANTLNLITELATELPLSDLTGALRETDIKGERHPEEMLRLIKKLIEIFHKRPAEAPQLQDIFQKWGLSPESLQTDKPDLGEALGELFQFHSETEFNPEDYKPLLDSCSATKAAPTALASLSYYGDPFSRDEVRSHAAEIATELLACPDEDKYHPGLFAQVDSAAELLLEQGNIKAVHKAATAAEAHRLLKTNTDETRLAAQGFLDSMKAPDRIDAIIECAYRQEQIAPEGLDMLRKAGADALGAVLEFRARQGWSALGPMLALIRELPRREAIFLFEKLLDHEQHRVRREALRSLWEIDVRWESIKRYLQQALRDGDRRIESAALQRLGQWGTWESVDLLGGYIEGKLSGRLPPLYHCRQAAEIMVRRGEAGGKRLCRALRFFCRSCRKARWAKLILDVLQSEAGADDAGKFLRIWRFSPARLSYFFLTAGRYLIRRPKRDRSS